MSSQILRGFLSALVATFTFTTLNALLKTLQQTYPPTELVFFRNFFALIPYLFIAWQSKEFPTLKEVNIWPHVARGAIGTLSLVWVFQSLLLLPLSDATTIGYMNSIFIVLLAVPLLGERLTLWGWAAAIMGFIGVVFIAQPTGSVINHGIILALVSALTEGFLMVHGRRLAPSTSNSALLIYFAIFTSLFSGLTLPFLWVSPTLYDFFVLSALGLGGGIGQYFITVAYRYTPMALLSPLLYTSIIWSILYGYYFFKEKPTGNLLLGAICIISGGLLAVFKAHTGTRPSHKYKT